MTMNKSTFLTTLVLAGFLLVLGFWWLNRGYGEVSPMTYEYSKALYSACLNRNEEHLGKVEGLLATNEAEGLPANERKWIDAIIAEARDGQWETAATKARRMMEDQVQY